MSACRVVFTAVPALVVVGAWTATSTYGAAYSGWGAITGDQLPEQALWHLAYAGLGSVLALVLRWPRLLIVWGLAHALIFTLGLAVFGHWAYLILAFNPAEALPLLLPLPYVLAGLALGWRPGKFWNYSAFARPLAAPAWLAFAPAALFGLSAARPWLGAEALPQAGQVQPWRSPSQVVPLNAWSTAILWATGLFAIMPYVIAGVVALGLLSVLLERRSRVPPGGTLND